MLLDSVCNERHQQINDMYAAWYWRHLVIEHTATLVLLVPSLVTSLATSHLLLLVIEHTATLVLLINDCSVGDVFAAVSRVNTTTHHEYHSSV
jgi:hypothetical protein